MSTRHQKPHHDDKSADEPPVTLELDEIPDHARGELAMALWRIDPDAYPDVASAICAAVKLADTYECTVCGLGVYVPAEQCRDCGCSTFIKKNGVAK